MHAFVGILLGSIWFQAGFIAALVVSIVINLFYAGFISAPSKGEPTSSPTFLSLAGAMIGTGWVAGGWSGVFYATVLFIILLSSVKYSESVLCE